MDCKTVKRISSPTPCLSRSRTDGAMVWPRNSSASTQASCRRVRRQCSSATHHSTFAFNEKDSPEERVMKNQGFTASFTVDQSPEEVFKAVNNVRGWWSGEVT